jgi:hypothetical protein
MIITIKKDKHRCDKLIPSIRLNTIEGYYSLVTLNIK